MYPTDTFLSHLLQSMVLLFQTENMMPLYIQTVFSLISVFCNVFSFVRNTRFSHLSASQTPKSMMDNYCLQYLYICVCILLYFTAQCTLVQMRGIGIACRPSVRLSVCPSVCPSVTLVICDHIGWKS